MRLGYIVEAKPQLIDELRSKGNDLYEYFQENQILVTEEHDYDDAFEGYKKAIIACVKNTFIKETVLNLDYSSEEMFSLFGKYSTNEELFDRWWLVKEADCEIVQTSWLST